MIPIRYIVRSFGLIQLPLLLGILLLAQEVAQEKKFFQVQITKDEIYTYKDLKFTGDYISFESPSGTLALGRTDVGVTIMMLLSHGSLTIEAPEAVQEKFKTVFGGYPLKAKFQTLYMRLNPKEYNEVFGQLSMTKSADEAALAKAKELYDQKFLGSYHAGPMAILPQYKTRFMDFDVVELGQLVNEEGYWLALRRVAPYARIYPANFVNPKQK